MRNQAEVAMPTRTYRGETAEARREQRRTKLLEAALEHDAEVQPDLAARAENEEGTRGAVEHLEDARRRRADEVIDRGGWAGQPGGQRWLVSGTHPVTGWLRGLAAPHK